MVPINYILLLVFTFATSLMVATICVKTDPEIVLEAAVLTAATVMGLTFYACTTTTDFTSRMCSIAILWGILFDIVLSIPLMIMFGPKAELFCAMIGAVWFGIYIIIDTQLIMGGKHR